MTCGHPYWAVFLVTVGSSLDADSPHFLVHGSGFKVHESRLLARDVALAHGRLYLLVVSG
jgi:hypothetical protein